MEPANTNGTRANGTQGTDRVTVEALLRSKLYRDYERAFSEATGLPLALRPVGAWNLPHRGKAHENPFCALMAKNHRACAACLAVQEQLSRAAEHQSKTLICPYGMCETAVPVRAGGHLIGFLEVGQVFRTPPNEARLKTLFPHDADGMFDADIEEMKKAWIGTPVIPRKRYESIVRLLAMFAQQLSAAANEILIRQQNNEPPVIVAARRYIDEHNAEPLTLGGVAKAVNSSVFHFCKLFKKVTGVNFTNYVSRVRLEKARKLLTNPNQRISEAAYEVGFQSLTHFNRIFRRVFGESPTEYRAHLGGAAS